MSKQNDFFLEIDAISDEDAMNTVKMTTDLNYIDNIRKTAVRLERSDSN